MLRLGRGRAPRPHGLVMLTAVVVMVARMSVTVFMVVMMTTLLSFLILFQVNFARQIFFAVDVNIDLGCRYSSALDAGNFEARADVKSGHGVFKELRGHSGIQQGA